MARSRGNAASANEVEEFTGRIESISRSYGSGWRFGTVSGKGRIVGDLPDELRPGDYCVFRGFWKDTDKYGRQFQVLHVRVETPRDIAGIQHYLDRYYPWIGPVVAQELVGTFEARLFEVIEKEPETLTTVNGITMERARAIQETYLQIKDEAQHDIFFSTHGITQNLVRRLLDSYGTKPKAVRAIKENPYQLADEVWGVGFKRADDIGTSIGIPRDSSRRIRAGIRWVLQEAANGEGHTCLPVRELLGRACAALDAAAASVTAEIDLAIAEQSILLVNDVWLYDPSLYRAEVRVAGKLREMVVSPFSLMMHELSEQDLEDMDPDQAHGLDMALHSRVSVITGGPGVGKTWLIQIILKALGPERKVLLAAPTGKAAKRMSEVTRKEASTLHRLLEYSPQINGFRRNEHNPIDADTVIVDETSMIDIRLMAGFMAAIGPGTQVIFVGDVDQLPSVGPGRVLNSMIESGMLPVSRLRELHRQAAHSLINVNARHINAGEPIEVTNGPGTDFWFVPEEVKEMAAEAVVNVCRRVPETFGLPLEAVQVLCPQKKGVLGTIELNKALRPVLNPKGKPIHGMPYQTGDRVIQTKNNYDLDIFNGDIGTVMGLSESRGRLVVEFEDITGPKLVEIPPGNLDELQPAYALTVHKSQGSEFPCVVMPVHSTNHIMLKRNLLYTAVTRARTMIVLVGTMKAVGTAIRTLDSSTRYSNLEKFIVDGT